MTSEREERKEKKGKSFFSLFLFVEAARYARYLMHRRHEKPPIDIELLREKLALNLTILRNLFSEELKKKTKTTVVDDLESLWQDLSVTYQDLSEDEQQVSTFADALSAHDLQTILDIMSLSKWREGIVAILSKYPAFLEISLVSESLEIDAKIISLMRNEARGRLKRTLKRKEVEITTGKHQELISGKFTSNLLSISPPFHSSTLQAASEVIQGDIDQTLKDIESVLKVL